MALASAYTTALSILIFLPETRSRLRRGGIADVLVLELLLVTAVVVVFDALVFEIDVAFAVAFSTVGFVTTGNFFLGDASFFFTSITTGFFVALFFADDINGDEENTDAIDLPSFASFDTLFLTLVLNGVVGFFSGVFFRMFLSAFEVVLVGFLGSLSAPRVILNSWSFA